jgi:hypothetical protein
VPEYAANLAGCQDARSEVAELDEGDGSDDAVFPEGEFVLEESVVQVVPRAEDEFTCTPASRFRHRPQIVRRKERPRLLY